MTSAGGDPEDREAAAQQPDAAAGELTFLVFLGSTRTSGPPYPARLGHRVALHCRDRLATGGHGAALVDPLELDLPSRFKPHFAYRPGESPQSLSDLARQIEAADGYVMVSPEYNHSLSPALAHVLNHFGSSLFSYKPSAIVTYSAGQWGGVRAAIGMRTFLSELGCLPVSAMVHVPAAQTVLEETGAFSEGMDASRWGAYFDRALKQLVWWAEAARRQCMSAGLNGQPRPFVRDPSQRNAP